MKVQRVDKRGEAFIVIAAKSSQINAKPEHLDILKPERRDTECVGPIHGLKRSERSAGGHTGRSTSPDQIPSVWQARS